MITTVLVAVYAFAVTIGECGPAGMHDNIQGRTIPNICGVIDYSVGSITHGTAYNLYVTDTKIR